MAAIQLIVVTPEATVVDTQTHFVALPFHDGELGIGLSHAPLIGRLGAGELRFEADGKVHRFFVNGGFVQVADNVVSVMADRAIPAAKLDAEDVRKSINRTMHKAVAGDDQIAQRAKELAQARAMLRIAERV